MKRLFLLILIIPSLLLGQTKDELDLCMAIQGNSFSTNTAAENALNRILNTIGASKNFVLSPCDRINNAVATAYKGTRYILYDRDFMNLINRNTNSWSSLFILAHEVGHHINGHSIDILLYAGDVVEPTTLTKKRQQELEADKFAAFVLAKLGASLSQLNNVITLISNNSNDTYSTHPSRDKRLKSVRIGFENGSQSYVQNRKKDSPSKSNSKTSFSELIKGSYSTGANNYSSSVKLIIGSNKLWFSNYSNDDKLITSGIYSGKAFFFDKNDNILGSFEVLGNPAKEKLHFYKGNTEISFTQIVNLLNRAKILSFDFDYDEYDFLDFYL